MSKKRKNGTDVSADPTVVARDLSFFLLFYAAGVLAGVLLQSPRLYIWKVLIAVLLVIGYIVYARETLMSDGTSSAEEDMHSLYLSPRSQSPATGIVVTQVVIALVMIVAGAEVFVGSVEHLAQVYGVPAFVLSLIIAPVATELPEKFNSMLWVSRDKDTLAMGNITGAMVFQGSLIVAIGMVFTPWVLSVGGIISGLIALVSGAILWISIRYRKRVSAYTLVFCGLLYLVFVTGVVQGVIR